MCVCTNTNVIHFTICLMLQSCVCKMCANVCMHASDCSGALHGWMGLLVVSLIISGGKRGGDGVQEGAREKEVNGRWRETEMTALANLPLLLAFPSNAKGGDEEEEWDKRG